MPTFQNIFRASLLSVAIVLSQQTAFAETYTGRVVGVSDGDTITVLDSSNTQHKIRLESVDIQASQMTLATNAIKEAKRAASLS